MLDKILVAIDGSDGAQRALQKAIDLRKLNDGELLLLSVYQKHDMWKASISMARPELTSSTDDALVEYARTIAEQSKEQALQQGLNKVRAFYIGGAPARKIVQFSKDYDVDLIVIGSQGLNDSELNVLGSVSHKVSSLAECPVMIV